MSDSSLDRNGSAGDRDVVQDVRDSGYDNGYGGGVDGDSVTTVTSRSWFSRIGGALTGLLIGLILLPLATWLLAWNEGRAVQTARSLAEGAAALVRVAPDRVDPQNEGRLVHVTGPLAIAGEVADPEFGVRAPGAIRLRRQVEMYQWREDQHSETRNKLGGGQETVTTYTYRRVWSATPIDSSRFHQGGHANPTMRVAAREEVAADARLGAFRLAPAELQRLGAFQPLPAEAIPLRAGTRPIEGGLYLGYDPASPAIGDLRITWQAARGVEASILAQQAGQGFAPYQTRAGDRLKIVADGAVPPEVMIPAAEHDNVVLTWILRAVGALVIFIGARLLLQPLVVLADVVPLFGSIIGFGAGLIALLVTLLVAPVTIALAWLWVRPLVGIGVLAGGAALAVGVGALSGRRRAAALPAPAR